MKPYLSKADFREWVLNPTTQKVRQLILGLVVEESMKLAENCGKDQSYDRYRSGVLSGIKTAYDFETLFEGYDLGDEKDEVAGSRT